jgi:hypothetical protein
MQRRSLAKHDRLSRNISFLLKLIDSAWRFSWPICPDESELFPTCFRSGLRRAPRLEKIDPSIADAELPISLRELTRVQYNLLFAEDAFKRTQ